MPISFSMGRMIKKRTLPLTIVLLTLAAVASSVVLYAQSRIAQATTKWEYLVEPDTLSQSGGRNTFLNEKGKEGWELVAVATYPSGNTSLYFKRAKP